MRSSIIQGNQYRESIGM